MPEDSLIEDVRAAAVLLGRVEDPGPGSGP